MFISSLAIAIHTFSVLVLRWRAPRWSSLAMIAGVWVFVGLVVGIPNAIHRNEVYYGDTIYCQFLFRYLCTWILMNATDY